MLVSTARMTILHLISRYRWTGSAEPATSLCAFQAKAGADARLCCIRGGSLEREAQARDIRFLHAANLGRNYTPWGILAAARSLAGCVARERVDLLHAHTQHDHWLAALAQTFFAQKKVPLIRTLHETRMIRVGRAWRRIFNHYTAMNIAPSRSATDFFTGSGAIRPERVRTIHGGLDFSRFRVSVPAPNVRQVWGVPKDAPLIAHLSHIGPDRRQREMLEAFALLEQEHSRAWLVFLGQGNKSTVSELRERVRSFPFSARVVFSKDHSGENIPWPDQVAAADRVAVLAVGSEGSSRGAMEAMALARPVIGARLGVLPELIEDGKTGWLADQDDPLSIAGALRTSLASAETAARVGGAAAALIRARFRYERQAEETLALYREVLGELPRPAQQAGSR
jgi:glycosyltransferase involved in cell wall biosynthesis